MEFRSALVGRWVGEGRGWYSTIDDFGYHEMVEVLDPGRPFLKYQQTTQTLDGSPLHVESGYFRFPTEQRIELVVAQPTGIGEALAGEIHQDGPRRVASLTSQGVARTGTAKFVEQTRRVMSLEGDELIFEFWMAAVGQPMSQHLASRLRRDA
ncbi:MAG: heme-binding beta-barrel domain-containing protein [Ferrimicrobium sp.]|uniref:FABP family protein n=1 Tax=Ferrimicrobium acidiphilum TaxID=121039 RepID=A0ABV3Y3N7_9ACTN|nr:FABP family protein [Ferrimicrobium sp.]MCL5973295.1 FABP family protein [Actinomycetota bacterium]